MIHFGEIPKGMFVLHRCDNPSCVNPKHLFLGTQADNVQDRDVKGHQKGPFGESHHSAKLTEKDVREIRRLYSQGLPVIGISRRLGHPYDCVWGVTSGKTWKHVK